MLLLEQVLKHEGVGHMYRAVKLPGKRGPCLRKWPARAAAASTGQRCYCSATVTAAAPRQGSDIINVIINTDKLLVLACCLGIASGSFRQLAELTVG